MSAALHEVLTAVAAGELSETEALSLVRGLAGASRPRQGNGVGPAASPGPASYPLSRGQESLWAIHQADPSSCAYNLPLALLLHPDAQPAVMSRAFAAVVDRHPSLRIGVRQADADALQVVADPGREVRLTEVDLTGTDDSTVAERLRELVRQPFDLRRDPLYRLYLVRSGRAEQPILLLVLHHLVTDGVSSHQLMREFVANYESLTTSGVLPPPEPVPARYHEFVDWQREMLAGAKGQAHRRYWLDRLSGVLPTVLDRVVDHRRGSEPAAESRREGQTVSVELDRQRWAAVRDLARERAATPFSVLFSAFACMLSRHSGQSDICVLVPTGGRPTAAFERTVGYFVNPVALRIACPPDRTGRQLIESVRDELLDAQDHADYPYACVVDDLREAGQRDLRFDTAFYLQQDIGADASLPTGQRLVAGRLDLTQEGEFDLVVEVVVRGDHALVHLRCDVAQFEPAMAQRLATHYLAAIDAITAEPDAAIGAVELYSPAERAVLDRVNATVVEYPSNVTAVDLVLQRAARSPHTVAILDAEGSLTYRELFRRVERLAGHLAGQSIAPGSLVGILLDRRADLIVAMLAAHRAGCAYVPLDPAFPAQRLALIAEDAGLAAIVTDTASSGRLPQVEIPRIVLDATAVDGPAVDDTVPSAGGRRRDDLAYVLYTSGSTGVPKGVEISHGSLVNFLLSMAESPGCTATDRVLAITTVSFDIAALELLLPLVCGASVQIVPAEVARDGLLLAQTLAGADATIVQATPATWQMLLAAGWSGRIGGTTGSGAKILCGGEALTRELADQLLERADQVWNMYGPTETTIWSSASRVHAGEPISVGTPIANTRFYLLDEDRRQVPFGARGELYIGGEGVALGYRGRPELTAEKFVADPAGGRMFKTGDSGRFRTDGSVELFGRIDRQIKLRGYRIEPGEIEAALLGSGLLAEARVLLREDATGHRALVGFVQAPRPEPALADRLTSYLAGVLPTYMVPAQLVVLRELPMTPNGKVDVEPLRREEIDEIRRLFGHPATAVHALEVRHPGGVASAGDLARIVAEVAGLPPERIAADRPFGEYGFDSIRFTRLSVRLRDALGVTIPPTTFYSYPTLADLARHVAKSPPGATVTATPERETAYPPVAVIGIGGRLPESETLDEFWSHLVSGRDLVRPFPMERGFSREVFDPYRTAGESFPGGFLRNVDGFDAPLFRVSPREAAQMDPQHRLLLHAAREAMEDSGHAPSSLSGARVGVFVGLSGADYFSLLGHQAPEMDDHFMLGNAASLAANRISYLFNLRGPSATYDTACSSSLVAIHRAVRALQLGDCDLALAGGANLLLSPYGYLALRRAGALSPDGRCKTFDERADGYGRGEGVLLLMLRRFESARADGDPVHGILIGSAENHGGHTHSLTVPNPAAQSEVIVRAHEAAAVPPSSISYIEAHGTGTRLGDPIEVDALKDAFAKLATGQDGVQAPARIGLGSVKTNIGHLEAAAGVAGVVKVLLAMRHRSLPGLVHLSRTNPMVELGGSPFHLVDRTVPWEAPPDGRGGRLPRRAGVSSFGMGGSNVHVVLEEARPHGGSIDG